MNAEELMLSSAASLAKLVRTKKVSSQELVQAAIRKIKKENPDLNAVIHLREEKAICQHCGFRAAFSRRSNSY